jgi:hypothetical protein
MCLTGGVIYDIGGYDVYKLLGGALAGAAALIASTATAASAAPLFPQCPPVGSNAGCSQLVVINPNGTATVQVDPAAPPDGYDGVEDTLIGVQNNSSLPISSVNLASTTADIFGFDQDGICDPSSWPSPTTTNTPPNCPGPQGFGTTGYEGPGTSFSNISLNNQTGTVNFSPALAPGGSAYFGLEEALQPGQLRSSQNGPIAGPVTAAHGVVTFDLTCVGTADCNGKVSLIIIVKGNKILAVPARTRRHRVTVGALKISIPSGETGTLHVHLNKTGKALLKKHRHGFTVTIHVTVNGTTYTIGSVKVK